MFEHDSSANDAVSRRTVLRTAGGAVAGSTVLAGLGAGRGAAETEEGLEFEVLEFTEAYIAVEAAVPDEGTLEEVAFPQDVFLGHAARFEVHEEADAVSLPEDVEALANPVEMDFENPHDLRLYFRTGEVDLSAAEGDEVLLGLGLFPERTVPGDHWASCPGHRDY